MRGGRIERIGSGKAIAAAAKGEELSEDELADVAGGEIIWSLDDGPKIPKGIIKNLNEGNYGEALVTMITNPICW